MCGRCKEDYCTNCRTVQGLCSDCDRLYRWQIGGEHVRRGNDVFRKEMEHARDEYDSQSKNFLQEVSRGVAVAQEYRAEVADARES